MLKDVSVAVISSDSGTIEVENERNSMAPSLFPVVIEQNNFQS